MSRTRASSAGKTGQGNAPRGVLPTKQDGAGAKAPMKKRTYGTGTSAPDPEREMATWSTNRSGRPVGKRKPFDAANEKAAQKLLSDWVAELDGQNGPSCRSLDRGSDRSACRRHGAEQLRIRKYLGSRSAKRKNISANSLRSTTSRRPLKKADIKRYKTARRNAKAAPATINRELAWLHRCLVLGNDDELIVGRDSRRSRSSTRPPIVRMGVDHRRELLPRSCARLPQHSQPVWCVALPHGCSQGRGAQDSDRVADAPLGQAGAVH